MENNEKHKVQFNKEDLKDLKAKRKAIEEKKNKEGEEKHKVWFNKEDLKGFNKEGLKDLKAKQKAIEEKKNKEDEEKHKENKMSYKNLPKEIKKPKKENKIK